MSDYERTKMYEDIIARLEQQNADLAEENLAAHLVNREFADEVRELKQQFKDEIVFLKQQIISKQDALNAALSLSEERRVALEKCSPFNAGYCKFCRIDSLTEQHKPNCDYVRLVGGEADDTR
jgi:hypothetical protein